MNPSPGLAEPLAPAILAFDIDGTVLDRRDEPVPGIVATLHDLAAAGVMLVPCTGRPLHGALRAAAALGVSPAACVAYHGALVADLRTGEWLRQLTLPDELAGGLAAAGLAAGLDVSLYVGDERLDLRRDWTPPVAAGASGVPGVTRLVLAGDPRRVTPALPLLGGARRAGQRIEHVRPGVVVVLPSGADKGEGLRLVADHFGVSCHRVVACGDDANDITLLLAAGHAVAVGDAPPALRAVATTTVAQDGLATALRHAFARLG